MDYMKLLYRILKQASLAMETEEIPAASEVYLPDIMKGTEREIESMIYKAYQEGFIEGIHAVEIDGMSKPKVLMQDSYISITIKGLEYLADNSMMKKAERLIKGIKDMIPGA